MGELSALVALSTVTEAPAPLTTAAIATDLLFPDNFLTAGQFTYSIPTANSTWPGYDAGSEPLSPNHLTPLNAQQAARFADALSLWDNLIAPNFTPTDDASSPGVIRVAFTDAISDTEWGHTFRPNSDPASRADDIWISSRYAAADFQSGSYDYMSLLHEIGHALGLKHSFDAPAIPSQYDTHRYTVMSYTEQDSLYAVSFSVSNNFINATAPLLEPSTPMVLDIAAVQARYGADPTTAPGDTVYSFNQNQPMLRAIYDAAGVDTIDTSSFTRPSDIDLTPGAYSSLGLYPVANQIADWIARFPGGASFIRDYFAGIISDHGEASIYTGKDNLGIAFSTTIENAVGGSGDDTITGNTASNGLYGSAGNDFIRGLDGNDVIDGGPGNDDVNGNQGIDVVHGGDGGDSVRGGQGDDTVFGDAGDDPHVNGNIGNDSVSGGQGADTVYGGQGNDVMSGDEGNDWLSGDLGNDTMTGGPGADRFLFRAGSGHDVVTDFNSAQGDRVQLAPGTQFSATDGADGLNIDLGGGDVLTLQGVTLNTLGDWLVYVA